MRTLTLSLKKKWYDMIASGEKTEEYRERCVYWHKRLNKPYDAVMFTNGYPKKGDASRRMVYKLEGIKIGYGKPEWGAIPNRSCFVIKLGKRL